MNAILNSHREWMQRCLDLARTNAGTGNLQVASIIVRRSDVLAQQVEELPAGLNPVAHAEALAIRSACLALESRDLSGCTLYTTVEPCWLCSYLISDTNVSRVVYGCASPSIGGATSAYPVLTASNVASWARAPEVTGNVLEAECKELRSTLG